MSHDLRCESCTACPSRPAAIARTVWTRRGTSSRSRLASSGWSPGRRARTLRPAASSWRRPRARSSPKCRRGGATPRCTGEGPRRAARVMRECVRPERARQPILRSCEPSRPWDDARGRRYSHCSSRAATLPEPIRATWTTRPPRTRALRRRTRSSARTEFARTQGAKTAAATRGARMAPRTPAQAPTRTGLRSAGRRRGNLLGSKAGSRKHRRPRGHRADAERLHRDDQRRDRRGTRHQGRDPRSSPTTSRSERCASRAATTTRSATSTTTTPASSSKTREIDGTSATSTSGISFANYTARRLNIHGGADGLKADSNVLIEDCWIHDLVERPRRAQRLACSPPAARASPFAAQLIGGASNAAVQTGDEDAATEDLTIECNWLDGGGYTLNIRGDGATVPKNTRRQGQPLRSRLRLRPVDHRRSEPNVVTGNVYDDDDEPIPF